MNDLAQPVANEASQTAPTAVASPLWLLAELTYRCPLHCVFCYNPVDYTAHRRELDTTQWLTALREAQDSVNGSTNGEHG